MVVDVNGGCDVHGRDETQTVLDAATLDDLLDLIGDVYHLPALACFKDQVFGVALQDGLHSLD